MNIAHPSTTIRCSSYLYDAYSHRVLQLQQTSTALDALQTNTQTFRSNFGDQLQKLTIKVDLFTQQLEGLAGSTQRTERLVKDIERDQTATESKFSQMIRDVYSALASDRTAASEERQKMEARLSSQIASSSANSSQATTALAKQLLAKLDDRAAETDKQMTELKGKLEERVEFMSLSMQSAIEAQTKDTEARIQRLLQELEGRFTTFKQSVTANVTEFHTTMMLMNEKTDALSAKISHILKTIVIM